MKIKKEYIKGLSDTLLIVTLTMLPTIFLCATIVLDRNSNDFLELYKSGEFMLYGVSFLGSAYLVYKKYYSAKLNWPDIFCTLIIIAILFFSISFAVVKSLVNPNYLNVKYTSIFSILVSIPFLYYAQVISNKQNSIDVGDVRRNEQKAIESSLK